MVPNWSSVKLDPSILKTIKDKVLVLKHCVWDSWRGIEYLEDFDTTFV